MTSPPFLPDSAVAQLQRVAESAMQTSCRIIRPTGLTFDPVTNTNAAAGQLVWSGYCHIELQPTIGIRESATALVPDVSYRIYVPLDAIAANGDVLQALDDNGTPVAAFGVDGVGKGTWDVQQTLQVSEIPVIAFTLT